MTLKKHLFVTGKKQVGKSTLLRRLTESANIPCTGFVTLPLMIDGERRGFYMHGLCDMPSCENDPILCVRLGERRIVPVLPAFEENGVKMLKLSEAEEAPWIMMDELGKMESGAPEFCQAVWSLLDGPKRCIGVLQDCDAPLINAIRHRGDVTLIVVNEKNREECFHTLLPMLRS